MLLIGSRAIVHYFPDFRAPRDWDLFATSEEIAEVARRLPRIKEKDPKPHKAYFYHGESMVEIVNVDHSPEWAAVYQAFRREPTIQDPLLGTLTLAPAAFLMLTKQCGLIYDIAHWHKNLEDLYFLRDRIASVPEVVTQVMSQLLADSRRLFAESTAEQVRAVEPCYSEHDEAAYHPRTPLHTELHQALALAGAPAVAQDGAWQGFPDVDPSARRQRMIELLTEETMVMAAERWLTRGFERAEDTERVASRWALRTLITSRLAEGWRYFAVNHYREIMAALPRGFGDSLDAVRARFPRPSMHCLSGKEERAERTRASDICGRGTWAANAASNAQRKLCE